MVNFIFIHLNEQKLQVVKNLKQLEVLNFDFLKLSSASDNLMCATVQVTVSYCPIVSVHCQSPGESLCISLAILPGSVAVINLKVQIMNYFFHSFD